MTTKQKKMELRKRPLEVKVPIPNSVSALIENNEVILKGPLGEVRRKLVYPGISVAIKDKDLVIVSKKSNRKNKRIVFTFESHLKNMAKGASEGFKYLMKICSGHFPMTVAVQGEQLVIKNFFGEKMQRTIAIPENVKVKVEGDKIVIESADKELAGMLASRIEEKTRRRQFDPRIFQDGIYIIEKGGKKI